MKYFIDLLSVQQRYLLQRTRWQSALFIVFKIQDSKFLKIFPSLA